MQYIPTSTELFVSNLLKEKGITNTNDLNIDNLSNAFGLNVIYADTESALFVKLKAVVVNQTLSKLEQYNQFLHELSHYILDHETHNDEIRVKHTEAKADYVMMYIAMPYFLIDKVFKLNTVEKVSEYFYVKQNLAIRRMEKIRSRHITRLCDNRFKKDVRRWLS